MMNLAEDLARLDAEGRSIRIGLIGAGEMGTDIVTQVSLMPGLRIATLASPRVEQALKAFDIAGICRDRATICDSKVQVESAVRDGKTAVCPSAELAYSCEQVDVVIDATGRPNAGAEVAMGAMAHGKHMVMMNVETDVTVGPYLRRQAERAGVVYTLGAGDEPSATMELINFVRSLGYPVIAAGKGKNNAFNVEATPDQYRAEAERRNMNPRMLVEFVDGSKTMIEMTAIANATGLVPDKPGMHGPDAPLDSLHKVLCPRADGGILSRKGVVDFTVAKGVAPGVFVVAEMSHKRLRERMSDLQLGPGPYYTFFRPHHLTSLEVPLSAAATVLYGAAHMRPLEVPVAECAALAKKDLAVGEKLDAIGEYGYRGWAMTRADAKRLNALPLGLAQGAVTTVPIGRGEYLTYDNCRVDDSQKIVQLRRLQDHLLDDVNGA
ncbi:MAG: homoserine dehydrogenase [Proteobacteria bacterium]|nr:homoserine dehydrogenase [Pseudomonadota bacterium]